jgi:hypothetical protein
MTPFVAITKLLWLQQSFCGYREFELPAGGGDPSQFGENVSQWDGFGVGLA